MIEYSKNFYEILYASIFGFGIAINRIKDNLPTYTHFVPYTYGNIPPPDFDLQIFKKFLEEELLSPWKLSEAIYKIKKDYPELHSSEEFEFILIKNDPIYEKVFYYAFLEFENPPISEMKLYGDFENLDSSIAFPDNGKLYEMKLFSPMWKIFAKVNGQNVEVKDYYASIYITAYIRQYATPKFVF